MPPTNRSAGGTATTAGLLLLTLVLRLTVILVQHDRLHSDPDAYVRLATMLADGQGYATADAARPTAFRPILYPLLLAGPMAIGWSAPVTIAAWNLVSGLLLVWCVTALARECGLSRYGCLLVGILAAADPLLLRYSTEPMTENVCAALVTAALLWLVRFTNALRCNTDRPVLRSGIIAGVLLGLSALCRPVVLVTCVLLTLCLLIPCRRTGSMDTLSSRTMMQRCTRIMLPAMIAALTVSPWVIRNAVQFSALIPATTHGGYTLLLGNNSEFYERVVTGKQAAWDGDSLARWQETLQEQMVTSGIDRADERAVDRWMYQQALSEIRQQPQQALQAVALRWRRFWALTPTNRDHGLPPIAISLVGLWYGLLGLGMILSLLQLRRQTSILLLWMSVVSFLLVHSFYWTNTRMRAPLTGVLIVLAVTGWSWLINRRPSPDRETAGPHPGNEDMPPSGSAS